MKENNMSEKEKAGKDLPLKFVKGYGNTKGRLVLAVVRLACPLSSSQFPQQRI